MQILFLFFLNSKAKLAAACAGILYFLSYVPCMYISIREDVAYEIIPWWAKTTAALLSTSAFGIGSKYIAFYENDGAGIQWSNMAQSPLENDTYNCLNCVKMMLVDCLIYLLLAWYIENVNPSYGIPLPWTYPFRASFWRTTREQCVVDDDDEKGNKNARDAWWRRVGAWLVSSCCCCSRALSFTDEGQAKLLNDRLNQSFLASSLNDQSTPSSSRSSSQTRTRRRASTQYNSSIEQRDPTLFEPEPLNLVAGVVIRNLTKRYADAKTAVNTLSLNFYQDQITAFLGHNGAGKTTTMNMLTGLLPATSGHALIYAKDIRTDINEIRNNLGVCPQHNILFEKLTVDEHLWFYAKLKRMNDQ